MSDWKDILNDGHKELPQDKLDAYLEGRLSAEEQREVEMYLSDEGMESDAIEGLKEVSATDAQKLTEKINYRLKHDVRKQSHRKRKLFGDNKWGWLAVVMIIILCVLGYWVVKNMH